MDSEQLKRKLRDIKKLEINIRFDGKAVPAGKILVWDRFFSTKDLCDSKVKYSIVRLISMGREGIKEAYGEFFYAVFYQRYIENGISFKDIYNPALLSILDLSPGAGADEIKKKFRELAKKYHPDHGGDGDKMMELLEVYHKLLD